MRKIIAMIGEPATGKSTIMKRFIKQTGDWLDKEPVKLVPTMYNSKLHLYVLGRYEESEPFPGTDRMSMAVQPAAIEFIKHTDANVLFEGDRLGTQSFLEFLSDQPDTDFKLLVITADDKIIEERHIFRKDSQTETFKKGRKTKIENLRSNMVLMGFTETMKNEDISDQTKIVHYLLNELGSNYGIKD